MTPQGTQKLRARQPRPRTMPAIWATFSTLAVLLFVTQFPSFAAAPPPQAAQPTTSPPALFAEIPEMPLRVVRVIDDDFAPISDDDMKQMLTTARAMYRDKFGADNIRYEDAGVLSIEQFFARHLDKKSPVYAQKDAQRYHVGEPNDFERHKEGILKFVAQWTVEELQSFFPEAERTKYDSHEAIYAGIVQQMTAKIAAIAAMKSGGKALLRPEKAAYRSFLNWLTALESQKDYDVVLTNTFIVYDDITKPFPHSIFGSCKVGGVSHKNDHRTVLGGRVIMGSTFGMDTDIPMFMETTTPVSRRIRNDVTGAFVIAHELGHAVFKLPDHYDHPPQCLMNNSKELNYAQGYDLLLSNPGPCPRCQVWLEARDRFFKGEAAFAKGQWQEAVVHYTAALRQTPQNVDGYRPRYMAEIAYRMSRCYDALGRHDLALSGAKRAAELYRWSKEFVDWHELLKTRTPPAETP